MMSPKTQVRLPQPVGTARIDTGDLSRYVTFFSQRNRRALEKGSEAR